MVCSHNGILHNNKPLIDTTGKISKTYIRCMTKTRQKITTCVIHLYAVQAKLTDGDESQWLPPGAEKTGTGA